MHRGYIFPHKEPLRPLDDLLRSNNAPLIRESALNHLRPLHRALVLAFAAPALTALAADPVPETKITANQPPAAEATRLAQAQSATTPSGALEKIEVSAQREHYRGDVPI